MRDGRVCVREQDLAVENEVLLDELSERGLSPSMVATLGREDYEELGANKPHP